jgi:hypothetical protein
MPSWQPDWTDVPFDQAAARAAVEACQETATLLRVARSERSHLAELARTEWHGPHRHAFDRAYGANDRAILRIHDALLGIARMIEAAAATARTQQSVREEDRARWHAENSAELHFLAALGVA